MKAPPHGDEHARVEALSRYQILGFVHAEDRPGTIRAAEDIARGANLISFENRYCCKDGGYRWLAWTASPWVEQRLIFAAARDITDRKQAEQALRLTASELEGARRTQEENASRLAQLVNELEAARLRAEESAGAKGEFLANMSHEIRTPLNAIVGMTDLVLQTKLTPDQRECLNVVRDSTDSLMTLVNDVLDFSKIEARKIELENAEFNLREVLEDTLRILALRAHQKGLDLISDIRPDIPDLLVGDSARLRQVVMNVVGNAIKFTQEGEVVLRAALDSLASDKARLRFSVSDTGIGIPAEREKLIFEAFAQGDSSTTRKYGGTGLGLAIATRLVGLMGGRIWYESALHKGTTFYFTVQLGLPRRIEAGQVTLEAELLRGVPVLVVDNSATSRHVLEEVMNQILVVEDERITRHFLSEVLRAAGYEVCTASDGMEALAQLKDRQFDLLLLDIWLPGMNGLELLDRLPGLHQAPKAIIMTSDDTPEMILGAIRKRAYRYVVKPVRPEELTEYVSSALSAPPEMPPIDVISARPHWVELVVPCTLEVAGRIQSFLGRLDSDLSEEVRESVGRVFRELLLNAIEWGGQLDPQRKVRIAYVRARRALLYRIADPGPGFRFEDLAHAAVGQQPDQPMAHMQVRERMGIRPGGFGILMARAMVDELIYNEAHNEVLFIKYL